MFYNPFNATDFRSDMDFGSQAMSSIPEVRFPRHVLECLYSNKQTHNCRMDKKCKHLKDAVECGLPMGDVQ